MNATGPVNVSSSVNATRPGRRRLAALVLAALAGAGCCAGAAGISWWTQDWSDSLSGAVHTAAKGSELLPELVPVALIALAGLGATFATRGPARRAVGVLVCLGGLLVLVRAALAWGAAPVDALQSALTRPATPTGSAVQHPAGPVLAIAGGLLVVVAGVLVATGREHARRMGSAYDSPARRREQILQRARERTEQAAENPGDAPDPAEMWRAMDAGADLTDAPGAAAEPDRTSAPGREDPLRADTISPPDGPDAADRAAGDPGIDPGHREAHGPHRQPGSTPPGAGQETTG